MKKAPALVLLAAGASSRLADAPPQDRCKATADLAGRSALRRLIEAGQSWCCEPGAPPPLVITGHHHAKIAAELLDFGPVDLVRNRAWKLGRSGGIECAIRARRGRDLCLAPVDVPLVPDSVFRALLDDWEAAERPARGWLAPKVWVAGPGGAREAQFGHPLVLGRKLLEDLSTSIHRTGPDVPLRQLREAASPLLSTEVTSLRILDDLDTVPDLEHLRTISPDFSGT